MALRPRFSPGVPFSIVTETRTSLQTGTDPVKEGKPS